MSITGILILYGKEWKIYDKKGWWKCGGYECVDINWDRGRKQMLTERGKANLIVLYKKTDNWFLRILVVVKKKPKSWTVEQIHCNSKIFSDERQFMIGKSIGKVSHREMKMNCAMPTPYVYICNGG